MKRVDSRGRGRGALLAALLVLTAGAAFGSKPEKAAPTSSAAALPSAPAASSVKIELTTEAAAPRQVEDTTYNAIVRDYGAAWAAMARALSENRADLLGPSFVGVAQEKLAQRVKEQEQAGLRTRYVDHGHKLEAVFYSSEGSAMQLRDTAQIEIQLLDGDRVISTQNATLHYVALMTVGEDRWKVRVLEAVPGD